METITTTAFDELQVQDPDRNPAGPLVAMLGTMLALVFMLCACSPASAAELMDVRIQTALFTLGPAFTETITVTPTAQDWTPPAKDRWQRFRDALDAGPSRKYRVLEGATNSGVREACYEPCDNNCCLRSGEFSLAGARFGR